MKDRQTREGYVTMHPKAVASDPSDRRPNDPPPAPSAEVALEVALLSSQEHVAGGTTTAPSCAIPVVPAVLLSDDAGVACGLDGSRVAPIAVLRCGFHSSRLLAVVASLIGEQEERRDD